MYNLSILEVSEIALTSIKIWIKKFIGIDS